MTPDADGDSGDTGAGGSVRASLLLLAALLTASAVVLAAIVLCGVAVRA